MARFDFIGLVHVIGGVALFGFMLPHLGLYISLFVLLMVASHASHEFTWRGALLLSVILVALAHSIFVWGLELQFPRWPTIFTN